MLDGVEMRSNLPPVGQRSTSPQLTRTIPTDKPFNSIHPLPYMKPFPDRQDKAADSVTVSKSQMLRTAQTEQITSFVDVRSSQELWYKKDVLPEKQQ